MLFVKCQEFGKLLLKIFGLWSWPATSSCEIGEYNLDFGF